MGFVTITINGISLQVFSDYTMLEAARQGLIFQKILNETGACRGCVVEIEGARSFVTAYNRMVSEGMKVKTHSSAVLNFRKIMVELSLAKHNIECTSCVRNHNFEFKSLSTDLGCETNHFTGERRKGIYRDDSFSIVRDTPKCVLCERCVVACRENARKY